MTGAVITIDAVDMRRLQRVLDRLVAADTRALMDTLAGGVEDQTRERISETKTGPDGTPWAAWSARHARTRHAGQSLLQGEGDLLDSITGQATDGAAEIGSDLEYAATHQFGDAERNIPARPYLGVSPGNLAALEQLTEHWAEALLQ